jgi:hypothetical protein
MRQRWPLHTGHEVHYLHSLLRLISSKAQPAPNSNVDTFIVLKIAQASRFIAVQSMPALHNLTAVIQ